MWVAYLVTGYELVADRCFASGHISNEVFITATLTDKSYIPKG